MYQLCCETVQSARISQFSHAPSQFFWPAMCLAGARGPTAVFLLTWKVGSLPWAGASPRPPGTAAQVPPPRKEQGKATWAADTMSSLKASLVPDGGRRKDSNSFSLSAIGLPVCEVVCVCACLSPWKRTATLARICHSDLPLPLGLKGFSDPATKPSR